MSLSILKYLCKFIPR